MISLGANIDPSGVGREQDLPLTGGDAYGGDCGRDKGQGVEDVMRMAVPNAANRKGRD